MVYSCVANGRVRSSSAVEEEVPPPAATEVKAAATPPRRTQVSRVSLLAFGRKIEK